jgi:hypothetical protein
LFGRIHQEQSDKLPERLAAQALLTLLIDHDDAFAGIGDFGGGDEAGKASADHNYVRIACHRVDPPSGPIESQRLSAVNGKWNLRVAARPQPGTDLFQIGTCSRKRCSLQATLDLNLFCSIPGIWTKTQSRNTLAAASLETVRFGFDRTGAGT